MSNHYAKIVKLKNVRPHSNADRLQLATADGHQVIVSTSQEEGEIGVYFPIDSALSPEFLQVNDLVAIHDPDTGKKVNGGYFGQNGRVKAQRLRGEKSEGYWTTLDALYNMNEVVDFGHPDFRVGDTFDQIHGFKVCEKYITPATRNAMKNGSTLKANPYFHKHFDTDHLKRNMRDIPEGARIIITTKLHGTSQRLGYLYHDTFKFTFWQKLRAAFMNRSVGSVYGRYAHLIGSRNQLQGIAENFHGEQYRLNVVRSLIDNLHKGETLYFEVVGYEHTGKAIMPSISTKAFDKEYRKKYGDKVEFSYGCKWAHTTDHKNFEAPAEEWPQNDLYVYRITQQNQDGDILELSWDQVVGRCKELGVKTVPVIDDMLFFGDHALGDVIVNADALLALATKYAEADEEFENHIREGVVIRWEKDGKMGLLKHKSFLFLLGEGHLKSDDSYIDKEDVS